MSSAGASRSGREEAPSPTPLSEGLMTGTAVLYAARAADAAASVRARLWGVIYKGLARYGGLPAKERAEATDRLVEEALGIAPLPAPPEQKP